jgi:hypothetical protein
MCVLGMLGVSGFETSAQFVESQKPGVFLQVQGFADPILYYTISIYESLTRLTTCVLRQYAASPLIPHSRKGSN